ncbi:TPR repeat [Stappia aggregata IAM 12614]|uniref:TPR repeat n=1 Tax=Roseibium aggregatum (strain ATCC 25650 / DSM 13394 / JCM 20685 / NBRC 16684 / NCIMB 2208 / IAM 12614 / B1) TaxID=384765 RepID=A0NMM7_ROSAI|nr:tetratricopeptide repeat protein [Roseibium aggregatum]EAV46322.1 TPR repeat [Stappia aggregata IAM 12614] [Roseibium aggregatum IAM 12614]
MATQTAQNPLREKLVKGLSYHQSGEIEKAQRCYKLVLKKAPTNPDALNLLGVTYRQLGSPQKAVEYIQKAIAQNPKQASFYANLARAMMDIGTDSESMLAVSEKALSLNPAEREALNIKAIALTGLKQFEAAEEIFKSLIVAHPNYGEIFTNYGLLLRKSNRYEDALKFFQRAELLAPDNVENCIEQARCRLELKQFDASLEAIDKALERFKDNPLLIHEKARVLFSLSRTHEGLTYAEEAVKGTPGNYHCKVTLGVHYLMLGRSQDSIDMLKQAKAEAPGGVISGLDWNLSLAYLSKGDLETGWDIHAARFEDKKATSQRREFPKPEWQGEDISDKTVLLWGDQGLGDALKCGTMFLDIQARAKKLILEVSAKSVPFFQNSFPEILVRPGTPKEDQAPEDADYDITANMVDLARYFRRSFEAYEKAPYPVYKFNQQRARDYLGLLSGADKKPVIGVSWRSRNLEKYRARYYLSAPDFAPILDAEDAIYINLQYLALQKELDFLVARSEGRFTFFRDIDLFNDLIAAADLTAICDVVVSANTSVADMAGVLGVPCVRFGPVEPALLLGQANPPWYPSMKYLHIDETRPTADMVPQIIDVMREELAAGYPDKRKERLGL